MEKYVFSVSCAFQAKLVSVAASSMLPYTFALSLLNKASDVCA
ncbi:hypothetical protein APHMUC_0317 [Anaplasma phagocytophilum str. ApMUC09]|uniref:Uncharacterized protein n=1 Tax=Anaplasma phagocytophilum str. ApMUC09 TaxID=1359152 RepID=A0A0F3N814_ANAPH|nr:hypothetical protein APHMUC_0317 [Anaplasma phagocytophilum str. ApMUC09]